MRIASSVVQLSSYHEKSEIHTVEERFRAWGGVPDGALPPARETESNLEEADPTAVQARLTAELRRISMERRETAFVSKTTSRKSKGPGNTPVVGEANGKDDAIGDTRLDVMRMLVEKLSGEKVHIFKPGEQTGNTADVPNATGDGPPAGSDQVPEKVGWGVEYDYQEINTEKEFTSFQSSGLVKTADGKELTFDVSLEMSRERIDVTSLRIREGDAKPVDPLVINFNGNAAALTESKIDFDLNADGQAERISFVRSGSGFLVFDKNKDGVVNDGSELFGPTTGNGFAELSQLDDDGNGWIDEADKAYADLGIWTRSENGTNVLQGLKTSNVGAIYLQSSATSFELKNSANETDGIIQSTGVYLKEDGGAGTVQQVDLMS